MKKVGKQYLLIFFILIIITCLTLSIFYQTFPVVKETFLPRGLHNCYPYTSVHSPANSFKTKSKGWCSTKDFGSRDYDDYDSTSYNDSPVKCEASYERVSGRESHGHQSKAYCKKRRV